MPQWIDIMLKMSLVSFSSSYTSCHILKKNQLIVLQYGHIILNVGVLSETECGIDAKDIIEQLKQWYSL